jgi:glutamyl-tRNA(Gln) amidotransferase subunit E
MKKYKLNQKLTKQVLDSEYGELFETIVNESKVSPTTVAAFLTETLKALKRESVEIDKVSTDQIREMFKNIGAGELAKEAVQDVFVWLSKHEGSTLKNAINALGLTAISQDEITTLVDKVITENKNLIKERGEASFGVLMGIVMKSSRGRTNAALASKILRERLEELLKR